MQHDFQYVSRKGASETKKKLLEIIRKVQNALRSQFTFQYRFIGSSARNMITQDAKANIGFDFDVNICIDDKGKGYSAKEIRNTLQSALNKVVRDYGYDYCEDSTRVLTIKFKDTKRSRIMHSCDFAIVRDCDNGRQQYIRFHKAYHAYSWEYPYYPYESLEKKINWLKEKGLWIGLRDHYISKKNKNLDRDKPSHTIFDESIHEMCQKSGYNCSKQIPPPSNGYQMVFVRHNLHRLV